MNEILDFVSHYHKIINIHKGFFTYRYTEPNSLGENDFSGAIIYDSNVYRYSCKIKLFVDEEGTIVVDKDLIFKSPSHISLESEEINLAMTCTDSLHGIYSTNGTWIEWKKLIFKDQKLAFEEFSWQQGILNEKRKPRIIKLD